ncbi:MAG: STAS domain-containing protein [Clostridia bacterium]
MTEYDISVQGDHVQLKGELDVSNVASFKGRLYDIIDQAEKNLTLDMEELRYIDSAGLGILVGAYKRLKQKQLGMTIIHAMDNIRKLFSVTKLDTMIPIGGAREENI